MNNMHLYDPSIVQLYKRRYKQMNYNLLISVFGINRGIKVIKRNTPSFSFSSYIFSNDITALSASLSSTSIPNLILSDEIKAKFEEKNKTFAIRTKAVLNTIASLSSSSSNNKVNEDNQILVLRRSTRTNAYQRYIDHNRRQIYQYKVNASILIQKTYRGYLGRRNIIRVINNILVEQSTKSIISIQSLYRKFIQHKSLKTLSLMKKIVSFRKAKCHIIQYHLSSYAKSIKAKRSILINDIITYRLKQIITIQTHYRAHKLKKVVKVIIDYERNNYVIEYPFLAKEIQMKLYYNNTTHYSSTPQYKFILNNIIPKYKLFSFEYCPLRKIFVLYIKKEELTNGKYRCQLIVDGLITCDGRFPHIEFEDGQFYNLIEFSKGKVIASGNTKKTNGTDNDYEYDDDKDNSNESNESYSNMAKRAMSSDEEDRKTYETLRKNLSGRPPVCIYDKLNTSKTIRFNGLNDEFSND